MIVELLKSRLATRLKIAALHGNFDGTESTAHVLARCRGLHPPSGSSLLFTRDVGHHTCGWWKNPDYERCVHLSLAFFDPETHEPAPKNEGLTEEWLMLLFGDERRKLWCEPPYTDKGKREEIWHYRLFCDEHWQPIVPRGEVYSRELTERGWKSYSELRASMEGV